MKRHRPDMGRAIQARVPLALLVLYSLIHPSLAVSGSLPLSAPSGAVCLYRDPGSGPSVREVWLQQAVDSDLVQTSGRGNESAEDALREERVDPAARISPVLAFMMSAALPGTGQLAEGRNRAFAYLGAEALAWIAHFSWKDASQKKELESEGFADRYWLYDRWYDTASGDCPESIPPTENLADLDAEIQSQYESNPDAYYASLSKEDGYRGGWDDFDCASLDTFSPHRGEYSDMRDDSNTFLERAQLATTFAFLNRVVSAVDAYRTARGARLALSPQTNLELDVKGSLKNPRAALRLRRNL
jgi:hypothetical protein